MRLRGWGVICPLLWGVFPGWGASGCGGGGVMRMLMKSPGKRHGWVESLVAILGQASLILIFVGLMKYV